MDITYILEAGKRVVASKFNTNFNDVKTAVDALETDVADLQIEANNVILPDGSKDFTNLQSYKANAINNATNATPIVITAAAHGYTTGNKVFIKDVGGNTAANGEFTITRLTADTFSLNGSVGNGAYTSGGTAIIYPVDDENLVSKKYTDLTISSYAPKPVTLNAVNSAKVNASGYADFIAKVDDTSVVHYATTTPIVETDVLGRTHTITADETITGMTDVGVYEMLKEYNLATGVALASAPVAVNNAQYGKDLKVSFDRLDATDDYGLHTPTVIGSPSFAGGKFNSNGTTGLSYPITTLGTGAWCIQGKVKLSNTTSQMYLFRGKTTFTFGLFRTTGNRLGLNISSDGISMNIAYGTGVGLGSKSDWSTSVEYYIRSRFTNTQYLVDWSLDGVIWTNDIVVNSASVVFSNLSNLLFGIEYDQVSIPLIGTMDDLQVTVGSSTIVNKNTVKEVQVLDTATFYDGDYRTVTGVQPNRQYKKSGGTITETTFIRRGQATKTAGTMGTPVSYPLDKDWAYSKTTMPDFSRGISLTNAVPYTAPNDGFISPNAGLYTVYLSPIPKGTIITPNSTTFYFYPIKGGN